MEGLSVYLFVAQWGAATRFEPGLYGLRQTRDYFVTPRPHPLPFIFYFSQVIDCVHLVVTLKASHEMGGGGEGRREGGRKT
jgi:hypothetical protein